LGLLAAVVAVLFTFATFTAALACAAPTEAPPLAQSSDAGCGHESSAVPCPQHCAPVCQAIAPSLPSVTPSVPLVNLTYKVVAVARSDFRNTPEPPPPRQI